MAATHVGRPERRPHRIQQPGNLRTLHTAADVIFVSAEGARASRFNPIAHEQPRGAYRNINLAIDARASFVIDRPADRNRAYNVGERQIAAYLTHRNYQETTPGLFTPSP